MVTHTLLDPPVYPYFDLYPQRMTAEVSRMAVSIELESKYPILRICEFFILSLTVYHHFTDKGADKVSYPAFEIYPGHVVLPQETTNKSLSVKLPALYPTMDICEFLRNDEPYSG